jgi:hypothetical protein
VTSGRLEPSLGKRPTLVAAEGTLYEAELTGIYHVERKLYLQKVQLQGMLGFYDIAKDELISGVTQFKTESIDLQALDVHGVVVESEADLAVEPFMSLKFTSAFDVFCGPQ